MLNPTKEILFDVVEAAAVAGTSTLTSDTVDTKGFGCVTFIAFFGDVLDTAVLTLTAQGGQDSGGSDAADLAGAIATFTAGATDADSKLLIVDVVNPRDRYATATLDRATANAVVNGIICILSNPAEAPVAQVDAIGTTLVVNPA